MSSWDVYTKLKLNVENPITLLRYPAIKRYKRVHQSCVDTKQCQNNAITHPCTIISCCSLWTLLTQSSLKSKIKEEILTILCSAGGNWDMASVAQLYKSLLCLLSVQVAQRCPSLLACPGDLVVQGHQEHLLVLGFPVEKRTHFVILLSILLFRYSISEGISTY